MIHNLVVELTRTGVEVKSLKMRLESMASRLDFDERRARALEGVVQYRAGAVPPQQPPADRTAAPDQTAGRDRDQGTSSNDGIAATAARGRSRATRSAGPADRRSAAEPQGRSRAARGRAGEANALDADGNERRAPAAAAAWTPPAG